MKGLQGRYTINLIIDHNFLILFLHLIRDRTCLATMKVNTTNRERRWRKLYEIEKKQTGAGRPMVRAELYLREIPERFLEEEESISP